MLIGIPKEIKNHEYRVGLTPDAVKELVAHGHKVIIQKGCGLGAGFSDADYKGAGVVATAEDVFAQAELIVKVKEPQPVECGMLRPEQALFTYLHLAPDPVQTKGLVDSGATCIAYETITADKPGFLPLLAPMSEVAGRMSVQAAAMCLEKSHSGRGLLLGGVPGTMPAKVVIIGAGIVGTNAAIIARGMGAQVVVFDKNAEALHAIEQRFGSSVITLFANQSLLHQHITSADVVIGGVLVRGAKAPRLVSAAMVKEMLPGSVLVDVSIDQGGCFATSKPTSHAEPTFIQDEVVHYCVTNMPGAVARTSTMALTNATLPYVLRLADQGITQALLADRHLLSGLNVYQGKITCAEVAEALGYSYHEPESLLKQG